MGGYGSTRWGGYQPKLTVDECAVLDIDAWIEAGLFDHREGQIEWTSPRGAGYSLHYLLKPTDVPDCLYLYLSYSDRLEGTICEPITVLSRPQTLGGVRWHFFCRGWCGRRVRKLYFAPGKSVPACRTCLGLSYKSVQEHDRRLGIFRRNPEALEAAMKAGAFLPWKLMLKSAFRVPHRLPVTITGDSNAEPFRAGEEPA